MARTIDAKIAEGEGRPLAGIPLGIKDLFATQTCAPPRARRILGDLRAASSSTITSQLLARSRRDRASSATTDRDGLLERDLSASARWSTRGGAKDPTPRRWLGGSSGRIGCCRSSRCSASARPRPTPAARSAGRPPFRDGRGQADLSSLLALGHRRLRVLARPGRPIRANHARCRDPDALNGGPRSEGHHVSRSRGAGL